MTFETAISSPCPAVLTNRNCWLSQVVLVGLRWPEFWARRASRAGRCWRGGARRSGRARRRWGRPCRADCRRRPRRGRRRAGLPRSRRGRDPGRASSPGPRSSPSDGLPKLGTKGDRLTTKFRMPPKFWS